ncbi:VF_A0006 family four-cysteine protein [Paraburkholderia sediminicola]|uniref:VF_A0006 family four-cysteine protein n=1 Tax=Paraburkholderia sediminicola TaxID=458836 RepID=UPI0038B970CD
MRNLACLFLSITLASPLSALAFGTDNPDYDQCILLSLRNSQSSMAANAIRRSCEALYRNGELLLPREKSYHVCVLQNVQSVRDEFAVQQILRACQRQNQM